MVILRTVYLLFCVSAFCFLPSNIYVNVWPTTPNSSTEINCHIYVWGTPVRHVFKLFMHLFNQTWIHSVENLQYIANRSLKKCLKPAWLLIGHIVSTIWESSKSNICHTWRKNCFTVDNFIFLHSQQNMRDVDYVQEMWNTDKKIILIVIVRFRFTGCESIFNGKVKNKPTEMKSLFRDFQKFFLNLFFFFFFYFFKGDGISVQAREHNFLMAPPHCTWFRNAKKKNLFFSKGLWGSILHFSC